MCAIRESSTRLSFVSTLRALGSGGSSFKSSPPPQTGLPGHRRRCCCLCRRHRLHPLKFRAGASLLSPSLILGLFNSGMLLGGHGGQTITRFISSFH